MALAGQFQSLAFIPTREGPKVLTALSGLEVSPGHGSCSLHSLSVAEARRKWVPDASFCDFLEYTYTSSGSPLSGLSQGGTALTEKDYQSAELLAGSPPCNKLHENPIVISGTHLHYKIHASTGEQQQMEEDSTRIHTHEEFLPGCMCAWIQNIRAARKDTLTLSAEKV